MSKFKNYKKNTQGNISMLFGASIMAILAVAAIATDMSSMVSAKSTVQSQMDSAALATAVKKADNSQDKKFDIEKAAREVLEGNGYNVAKYGMPKVTDKGGIITLATTYPHQLNFGKLLGMNTADIKIESAVATNAGRKIEIALTLDTTASMGLEGRIGALRIAAYDFIDTIEDTNSGTRIAVVPFNRYVRIDPDLRGQTWLNTPNEYDTVRNRKQATHTCESYTTRPRTEWKDGMEYTYDEEVCEGQTTTYEDVTEVIESRWEGCIGVRKNGLHLVDGSYGLENVQGLLNIIPYERTDYDVDIKAWCPREITELTDNYEDLRLAIKRLYPSDFTYIPIGLSWARRVLSSIEPFDETNTVEPVQKIVVLMSDGKNTAVLDQVPYNNTNSERGVPYVDVVSKDDVATQANADTLALCTTIKNEGTKIFTIAFKVPDTVTKDVLQTCASSPGNFYDADSDEKLKKSFADIADSLGGDLRLMR